MRKVARPVGLEPTTSSSGGYDGSRIHVQKRTLAFPVALSPRDPDAAWKALATRLGNPAGGDPTAPYRVLAKRLRG